MCRGGKRRGKKGRGEWRVVASKRLCTGPNLSRASILYGRLVQ